MPTHFAPKPTKLEGEPTPTELETWINNLVFNLTIDGNFEEFLEEGFNWSSPSVANRGLVADNAQTPNARTAKQKAAYLDRMLGSISAYAPVISKRFITHEATSLNEIWDRLRTRFGCRKTGSLILDLAAFTTDSDESHEALWERILSFVENNLILSSDKIKHHGQNLIRSEEMTPTLTNICIVLWLKTIHPNLPALVKQKYATELRNKSLASIRDEISESINSLLYEISANDESTISRAYNSRYQRKGNYQKGPSTSKTKTCIICQTAKRPSQHFLSQCPFLPDSDRQYIKTRTRCIEAEDEKEEEEPDTDIETRRVDIESSPELRCLCKEEPVVVVLDTGAMTNCISETCAKRLNAKISPTKHSAGQADAISKLNVVGEVHLDFNRHPHTFRFHGLVVKDLRDDVLAGAPFLTLNDIYVRTAKRLIYIADKEVLRYNPGSPAQSTKIVRVPCKTTLLPGEALCIDVPEEMKEEAELAIEPRLLSQSMQIDKPSRSWLQPQIVSPCNNQIQLTNSTDYPVMLNKHEQVANISLPMTAEELNPKESLPESFVKATSIPKVTNEHSLDYQNIKVDPDESHSKSIKQQFYNTHKKYYEVFDESKLGQYNNKSGKLEVVVNMGPTLPPQRKGRMPLYNRKLQEEYQLVCDSLEGTVLVKPEDAGVVVEYLNPSFLIRKPSGKKRLVTAFGEVGKYSKPQPALMTDSNEVLRTIAKFKYLVKTDLVSAYWQMNLAQESMKYCGIATPFRGIRVYARGAMGMPGTETALEELLSRVLGDLLLDGGVVKIADDLIVGGSSPEEVLNTWEKVLNALQKNGLRLSANKTICLPKTVTILGWIWSQGTLKASPHRISALEVAQPPNTVGKLRSFLGSYKFLSKVIPNYSDILNPLEAAAAGKTTSDKINWTDSLLESFKQAQRQLSNAKIITLPTPDDHLQIMTDASKVGIAATLYVIRKGKPLIAGFFNAKLRPNQFQWIACELEALSIGAAVKHFGTDIVNSKHPTVIVTDSKPCVQSYEKLNRGEFSSSARVSTFLSILSRFNVKVIHIKGEDNQLADYNSRNPISCSNKECQICKFLTEVEESVVRLCTVQDVLQSQGRVPFSSRTAWFEIQQSCFNLRRTAAHLKQGTRPSKKDSTLKDVKRYLQVADIAKDGLVVVRQQEPFQATKEKIVVPKNYIHGLLVAIHLKLQHPSKAQLRKIFNKAYYALDAEKMISDVTDMCDICVSLRNMTNKYLEQSTSLPQFMGSHFNADVVKRDTQNILVLRENISSFTTAKIIPNEKSVTLKENLVILCSQLCPSIGTPITIRVDAHQSWRSLLITKILQKEGLYLELGHEKNHNKNTIVDGGIKELHAELYRLEPHKTQVTEFTLAKAVATMNDRVRGNGLSSREMWVKRDTFTGKQMPIDEEKIMQDKYEERLKSHKSSQKYSARGKTGPIYPVVCEGDLVYLNSERSKLKPRDKYIVVNPKKKEDSRPHTVYVQKFVGTQLRSRIYPVNAADIIKVPVKHPYLKDEMVESETSESENEELNHENEVEVEQPRNQTTSRPVRNWRRPQHLDDYIC